MKKKFKVGNRVYIKPMQITGIIRAIGNDSDYYVSFGTRKDGNGEWFYEDELISWKEYFKSKRDGK